MSSLRLNRTGNLVHLICSFFFFFTIVTCNSVPVKLKEVEGTNETLNNETWTGEKLQGIGGNSLSPSPFANVIKSSHLENPLQVLEALRKDFEQIRTALEKTWPQSQSNDGSNSFATPPASADPVDQGQQQVSLARSFLDGLSSIARRLPLVSQALSILLRSEAVSGSATSNGQLNDQRVSGVGGVGSETSKKSLSPETNISAPLNSLDLLSKTFDSFHQTVQQLPSDPTVRDEINKQEDIKLPLSPLHQRLQVHLQRMESIRNRLNEGIRNLLGRWVDTNVKLVLPNGEAASSSSSSSSSSSLGDGKSQIGDPSPSISFEVNDKPFVLDQVKGSNFTEDEKVASDFNTIRDAAAGVSIETFKTFGTTVDTLRKTTAFLTQLYTKLLASYILQATSEQLHRSVLDRIGGTAANIGNRVTGTFSHQVKSWMGTNNPKQLAENRREQASEPGSERTNEVTSSATVLKEAVDGTAKNNPVTHEAVLGSSNPNLDSSRRNQDQFDPFVSSPDNPYGSLHPLGVLSRELNQIIDLASSISNLG